MARSIDIVRDVFLSPADAFTGIKADPVWRLPCAIICVVSAALGLLIQPFLRKIALERLADQLGGATAIDALSFAQGALALSILAAPLIILSKCVIAAVVLYYAAVLFNGTGASFRQLVSVTVHAELILIAMAIVNYLLLEFKGAAAIRSTLELQPILGLDAVFRSSVNDAAILTILKSVNIFTLWYCGVLMCGVSVVCELRMWRSCVIVILMWTAMTVAKLVSS